MDDATGCGILLHAARTAAREYLANATMQRRSLDVPLNTDSDAYLFRLVAESAEDAGALHTASALLDNMASLRLAADPIDDARTLAHRARLAWKLGDDDSAQARYREVELIGRSLANDELQVRAWIGYVTLAQRRGNFPRMRYWANRARRLAESRGYARLASTAHHALLVVNAKAGDFDKALRHGWLAYANAIGDDVAELDALVNMGQVALDMGEPIAARAVLLRVLAGTAPDRSRIPALGALAWVSALVGDAQQVRAIANELRAQRARDTSSYQTAAALLECSVALEHIGDTALAKHTRAASRDLAERGRYHEIRIMVETMRLPTPVHAEHHRHTRATRELIARVEGLAPATQPQF